MALLDSMGGCVANEFFGFENYQSNLQLQQSRGILWRPDAQAVQALMNEIAIAHAQSYANFNRAGGMQDINASTETGYPYGNDNSMNKKLETAKKYLKNKC